MRQQKEKISMKNNKTIFTKRPLVAAAVIALCVCLCASALAMSGSFRDIKGLDGAVIGAIYENAHSEIDVSAHVEEKTLLIEAEMLLADNAPYREFEMLAIGSYKIVNAQGKSVSEGLTEAVVISNSVVTFDIPLANLEVGNYTIVINSFTGSKKADQPLSVTGLWECDFTV